MRPMATGLLFGFLLAAGCNAPASAKFVGGSDGGGGGTGSSDGGSDGGSDDGGTSVPPAPPPPTTTTLGTRTSPSQANPPITSNAMSGWSTYSRPEQYPNVKALPLQFITTSAGDRLSVLVTVPANALGNAVAGRFPVVLTQTAYRIDLGQLIGGVAPKDPTLLIGGEDQFLIKRGYISVAVDVLGTGMSSGVTKLLGSEEQAAYADTVGWITQQPWFDGNLGLAGTSYLAIAALLTAEQQNPVVKAVFAEVPMGDPYRGTVAPGGLLNANFIDQWMTLTQNLSVSNGTAEQTNQSYSTQIAAANQQHVQAIDDWYLPTINNALNDQPGYSTDDGTFWATRSAVERARSIKVPTFIVGGTNDLFVRDEPLLYEQLKGNVNTKLLIVPGAHLQAILDSLSAHDNASSTGAPDTEALLLQWFDQYLKGVDTGAAALPNVTQYVAGYGASGAERYATATDWPHPELTPKRMYLHGELGLDDAPPTATEASHTIAEPNPAAVAVTKSSDGTKLQGKVTIRDGSDCSSSQVQWTLGIAGLTSSQACYTNDDTVEKTQTALLYSTPPLSSSLYINGPIEADIWMSAKSSQAALAIRVDDVDASGNATPLTTGIQSAAYRAVDPTRSRYIDGVMIQPWHPFTVSSMQPLKSDQPVLVPVEIFPAAALIQPGHKLRIAISASNQAEGIWPSPKQAIADENVTTIYSDAAHPSSVVLPVVPASVLGP